VRTLSICAPIISILLPGPQEKLIFHDATADPAQKIRELPLIFQK
jgi:hypothetical protein